MSTFDMVEDLEQMRKYWGLKSIDILGHSNGGAVALGYAKRYPDHIYKLVLADSCLPDFDASSIVRQFVAQRKDDTRYASSIESLRQAVPKTENEFQKYMMDIPPFYFYDPQGNIPDFLETTTWAPSSWAYHASIDSNRLIPQQHSETLSSVRAKILILTGSEDPFCSPVLAYEIYQGLERSKLVVLREAGQFLWIEQPKKFFELIQKFLTC